MLRLVLKEDPVGNSEDAVMSLQKFVSDLLTQRLQSPICPSVTCKVKGYNTCTFHLSRDLLLSFGSIARKSNLILGLKG